MELINGISYLNEDEQVKANTCAFLSSFMYLDTQEPQYTGKTIAELVGDIQNGIPEDPDFCSKANPRYLATIQDAVASNPELGKIKIVSQSAVDNPNQPVMAPYMGFGPDLVVANAFEVDGDITVAYRGTGGGKWIDNGQGLGEERTVMQEAATRYFDYVYETQKKANPNQSSRFYVTGHSKGGNEAQYVCMTSNHNIEIEHCYEFDGQGFSPEAIEFFKASNGEGIFKNQVDKITAICGSNDYVNPLGVQLVNEKQKYFLPTVNSAFNVFKGNHEILYMFNQSSPDKLNFEYNESGNAVSMQQGNLGRFANTLSKRIMELPKGDRRDCAVTLMGLFDLTTKIGRGTGSLERPSLNNAMNFIVEGIPLLSEAMLSKEMIDAAYGLCACTIKEGVSEKRFGKILAGVGVGMAYAIGYVGLNTVSAVVKDVQFFARLGKKAINAIKKDVNERKQVIQDLREYLMTEVHNDAFKQINQQYGYPDQNIWESVDVRAMVSQDYTELLTVIASSSKDQAAYTDRLMSMEDPKAVVTFEQALSYLKKHVGLNVSSTDLEKRAVHIAIRTAAENIKNGHSTVLVLPKMYDPAVRSAVNSELDKYLEDAKYVSTAVMVYPEESSPVVGIMNAEPANTQDYHFVLTEKANEEIVSPDKDSESYERYEEFRDELYAIFGDSIGAIIGRPDDDIEYEEEIDEYEEDIAQYVEEEIEAAYDCAAATREFSEEPTYDDGPSLDDDE